MNAHKYSEAEKAIYRLLDEYDHDHRLFISLARCQLAQEKHDEAVHNYTHLLQHSEDADAITAIEAALVLDKLNDAFQLCRISRDQYEDNPEFHFFFALASYKQGMIKAASEQLSICIRMDFEWDDDDPIDFVAQQVLPTREFHDFEQLYLDAQEHAHENSGRGQNRWSFLNMPIWEVFSASDAKQQRKRAVALSELLSSHFDELFLSNGKSELWRIVNDLKENESQAVYFKSTSTAIRKGDYAKTAELVLALQLEHLQEFAALFGLSKKEIKESQLQNLLSMLPLHLAIGLLFLFSASHAQAEIPKKDQIKLPDDIFAGLIAACFVSFYQQVGEYHSQKTEQNGSDV